MFVAKQFKGTGNKVRPGEGDVHEGTTVVGAEHGDFKRFKSQIVGI